MALEAFAGSAAPPERNLGGAELIVRLFCDRNSKWVSPKLLELHLE